MSITPTQRTLKALKDKGLKPAIVEKWIAPLGIRKDLFGFIDIIAISQDQGIIGVQSTGSAFSSHYKKIVIDKRQEAMDWLSAGGKIQLWGWRKLKLKRGSKVMRWKPRIQSITMDDFQ